MEASAVAANLADEGGTDVGKFAICHEEEGFDAGEGAVGKGDLQLRFEVGMGAQTADENIDVLLLGKLRGQGGESDHFDVCKSSGESAEHLCSLFVGKEGGGFLGVESNADIKLIAEFARACDDVEVSESGGIKCACKERFSHDCKVAVC